MEAITDEVVGIIRGRHFIGEFLPVLISGVLINVGAEGFLMFSG